MTPEAPRPSRRAVWLRLAVVGLLLLLDLWTKSAVFSSLEGSADLVRCPCGLSHERWHLLGEGTGWLTFMLAENSGAAFGFGAAWPSVLVIGRIAAVFVLLFLLVRASAGRPALTTSFVLILSGALGNLYDNLGRANWAAWRAGEEAFRFGAVRDFIDVYFGAWSWHFPTFNVADSCISVGAVLLLASGLFARGTESGEAADSSRAPLPGSRP